MKRLRQMSYEVWRSEESSQHTYARAVEGVRELWRHVAGTEQKPAARIPAHKPGVAFVLRLVSDTLHYHETEQRGDVWKCSVDVCRGCVCDVSHLLSCPHPCLVQERERAAEQLTDQLHTLGIEHKNTPVLDWCRQLQATSEVDESVTRAAAFGAFTSSSMRVLLKRCGVGVKSGVHSNPKRAQAVESSPGGDGKRVVSVARASAPPPTLHVRGLSRRGGVGVCSGVESEAKSGGGQVGAVCDGDVMVARAIFRLRDVFLTSMWRLWRVSLSAHVRINVKPAPAKRSDVRAAAPGPKSRAGVKKKQ